MFRQTLPGWLKRSDRRTEVQPKPSVRLRVEPLEDRSCPSSGYLLVPSFDTHNVLRYDAATGAFVDEFIHRKDGGLDQTNAAIFGPHDHNLYVASGFYGGPGHEKTVLRYDGTTGAFLGQFTQGEHLDKVESLLFGPDGNLYVGTTVEGTASARVERFNGTTGAYLGYFVPPESGGLKRIAGMVFGPSPDGAGKLDLYAVSNFSNAVLRYDGTTGAFLGEFVTAGSGGLDGALGISLGPDGNLYVASGGALDGGPTSGVFRYQGPGGKHPGAFIDKFVPAGSGGLLGPFGVLFGPDANGDGRQDLYVGSGTLTASYLTHEHTSTVKLYDGATGAYLRDFVTPDSGGLDGAAFFTFTETDPTTLAYTGPANISISDVTRSEGSRGHTTLFTFTVTLSAAYDQPVTMSFRTVDGGATTSDNDYVAKTGTLTFAPGETTKTITIEVKGDTKKEADETFYLDLFGLSSNALFIENRGVGTIWNDD